MGKQKELDADPNGIQKKEFVGQLKSIDGANADGKWSMFLIRILEKVKETRLKFRQGSVTAPKKMANCKKQELKKEIHNWNYFKIN